MPGISKKKKKSQTTDSAAPVDKSSLPCPGDIISKYFGKDCTFARIYMLENSPFAEAIDWIKYKPPLEQSDFLNQRQFHELLYEDVPAVNTLHIAFNCYDLVLALEFAEGYDKKQDGSDNISRFKIEFQNSLFNLVRIFNSYLSGLNHLYEVMLSSNDLETIIPALVEQLNKIIEFDRLSVVTYHPEFESFCIEVDYDNNTRNYSFMKQFIRVSDTNIGKLLTHKGGVVQDSNDPGHGVVAKRLIWQGMRSFIYNPIYDKGELVASLNLASCGKNTYDQSDYRMMAGICDALCCSMKAAMNYSHLEQTMSEFKEAQKHFPNLEKARNFIDITRGVLHAFNNHLALIMGRAQILRQFSGDVIQRENLDKGLDIILNASTRASEQIAELQKYARLKPDDEPDRIQVKGLIEEIIELSMPRWKAMANGRIKFEVNIDDQIEFVGFRKAIREAMINVLMNAVESEDQEGGVIRISAENSGDMAVISISDNGPGIPMDQIPRVFDPFYSTKPNGSGLGLAVSYRTVREHKGNIRIESIPGSGTKIMLSLPIEQKSLLKRACIESPREIQKVLLVDSNKAQRNILQRILEEENLLVKGVRALSTAEKAMDDFRPDLIIFDDCLHDGDPLNYAGILKQSKPDIVICLLSTLADPEELNRLRSAGIDEVFTKPFQRSQILHVLNSLMKTQEQSAAPTV